MKRIFSILLFLPLFINAQIELRFYTEDSLRIGFDPSHVKFKSIGTILPADSLVQLTIYHNQGDGFLQKTLYHTDGKQIYLVGKGNNSTLGIWYRGEKAFNPDTNYAFSSLVQEELQIVYHETKVQLKSDTVAEKTIEKTVLVDKKAINDSLAGVRHTFERMRDKSQRDTVAEDEIWDIVASEKHTFRKVQHLKNYFSLEKNCRKADLIRALDMLEYDPLRLELLESIGGVCETLLVEADQEIRDTFEFESFEKNYKTP